MTLRLENDTRMTILIVLIGMAWTGASAILVVSFFVGEGTQVPLALGIGLFIGTYVTLVAIRTARKSPGIVEIGTDHCLLDYISRAKRIEFAEVAEISSVGIRLSDGRKLRFNWIDRHIVIELQKAFAAYRI